MKTFMVIDTYRNCERSIWILRATNVEMCMGNEFHPIAERSVLCYVLCLISWCKTGTETDPFGQLGSIFD